MQQLFGDKVQDYYVRKLRANAAERKARLDKITTVEEFKAYQHQVKLNAQALCQALKNLGYRIVAGGTDCHVFSVDLRSKNITGKQAEAALDKAGITCNKNTIPYDPQKPMITSGVRLGKNRRFYRRSRQ